MDLTLRLFSAWLLAALFLPAAPAQAQDDPDGMLYGFEAPAENTVTLTLEEALSVALIRNYDLRGTRLDVANAEAQVREAWGQLYPQLSASGSYTRNVITANPFAGSDIGGLFGGGPSGDWVAFNERARLDDDPSTEPITFQEFVDRQNEGRTAAGIELGGGGGNPFGVDNEFLGGLTLEQTLYNGSAFAAVKGAQALKDVNQRGVDRQAQLTIDQVRQAFYQALLAQEQMRVVGQSVERTRETFQEISLQVERGVAPKAERLGAEVELANLETQLVEAENQAGLALDNLKLTLGFPMEQPIRLRGALEVESEQPFLNVSTAEAVAAAVERRPDVARARLGIELNETQKSITTKQYLPKLSAVANFNYSGRVPDDRTIGFQPDPSDPFLFEQQTQQFFADSYWNPSLSVGLRLSWDIFNGFQTAARIQQDEVAVQRAELQYEQLRQQVRLEVQRALRNLRAARQRIEAQAQNVETAETNYRFARARLNEGVTGQLQLREASNQLDQSRLNYLQAAYDYLTAQSAFKTAVGMPLEAGDAFQFTRR